jgi:hypothetical protein
MKTKRATPEQVELILHLYELRREAVMRGRKHLAAMRASLNQMAQLKAEQK